MNADLALVVNAGSSSIKLSLYKVGFSYKFCDESRENRAFLSEFNLLKSALIELSDCEPEQALQEFLAERTEDVWLSAHRMVHPGPQIKTPCIIDSQIRSYIARQDWRAPKHNPLSISWITACEKMLRKSAFNTLHSDTEFFNELPLVAKSYALPAALVEKHGLMRVGFHGLAYRSMLSLWQETYHSRESQGLVQRKQEPSERESQENKTSVPDKKIIAIQLGSGCSICAIKNGVAQDTSMGFSTLEGLMMSTRCGDLDPGILIFMQKELGYNCEQIERLLNEQSGLLGVSTSHKDMRELLKQDSVQARLAVDLFCYRVRKYIGAYIAVLGGVDSIIVGGGIGEHSAHIREKLFSGWRWSGLVLDSQLNSQDLVATRFIHHPSSKVKLMVCAVNEADVMLRQALELVKIPQLDKEYV